MSYLHPLTSCQLWLSAFTANLILRPSERCPQKTSTVFCVAAFFYILKYTVDVQNSKFCIKLSPDDVILTWAECGECIRIFNPCLKKWAQVHLIIRVQLAREWKMGRHGGSSICMYASCGHGAMSFIMNHQLSNLFLSISLHSPTEVAIE